MGYKKTKKVATYALASAIVLSNFGYTAQATTTSTTKQQNYYDSIAKQLKDEVAKNKSKVEDKNLKVKSDLKANDKVRVIVELEGETPVEYATKQGKLYKELSEDTKSSLASKVVAKQKTVKAAIKAKGIKMEFKKNYSTAFNGFSGEIEYAELAKVENISGVKNIYLANEYNRPAETPDMKTSHSFIQSNQTWADAKLKGEGMIVSVIDTGVDPSHRDFVLTDKSTGALTSNDVSEVVQHEGLKGKFYTEKVPYGYNYYDENNTILDLGPDASMHGMHVAGTVAANGDEANGGIKGVAPEAQVLGMKVFSNDPNYPSTWSDIYLAAIDDSIKLGADVLNMSLGSTAAFYEPNSAEDLAITRAVNNGIVCSVSAGNSGNIAYGYSSNPWAANPDIGVVGSPGLNTDTIQVAASGNIAYLYQHTITVEGNSSFSGVGYGIDDWTKLAEAGTLELVSLGGKLGKPEDYAGLDVTGKVVVMPRGELTFFDKTKNAAAAGAAGIIVYNSTSPVFYENQGGWNIPFMKISRQQGLDLEAAIAAGQTKLQVSQTKKAYDAEVGRMTDFTSWGTTPSLELKPEITAPGGKIYSTLNNNKYGQMSGTSMAAPHVAGGSALVQQYLQTDERYAGLSASERTHLAKVLLMNTAKNIDDLSGQPFSPRRQGAGMMQTFNAVSTPVYVVNKALNEGKVELKDFQEKNFSMEFTATNVSDKDMTYKVDTSVLTDTIKQATGKPDTNALVAGDLEGAVVDAPETVTVPAGESVDFTVSVDFSAGKIPGIDAAGQPVKFDLKEDIFVEGFVSLTDANNALEPTLNVPYLGFYGKWDRPQIVDGFQELGEKRFYAVGKGWNEMLYGPEGEFTGFNAEKGIYPVSPNADGYNDDIYPLPAFLRNAAEVQYNILDKDGNFLRRVKMEKDVSKNFYDAGNGSTYSFNPDRAWDGTVKSQKVEDGLYYYEIKSIVGYEGAQWQSKKIPVYVDTKAPEVNASFDEATSTLNWSSVEDGSGIALYGVFVDGKLVGTTDAKTTSYQLSDLPEYAVVKVAAIDYASNVGESKTVAGDTELPLIFLGDATPEPFGVYDSLEVPVAGYVTDDYGVETVTVDGKKVEFTYDAEKKRYNFSTTVKFEKDGKYKIPVSVYDVSGKEFSIAREVFIDTTAPVIEVVAPEKVGYNVTEANVKLTLKDNFNYLSLYVEDNNDFVQPFKDPFTIVNPAAAPYEFTVPVKHGENKVTVRLVDLGGNETKKEISIFRAEKPETPAPVVKSGWVKENNVWFFYVNGEKSTGWITDKGKRYFLDQNGAMKTGWVKVEGKWHFLASSGAEVTGWYQEKGKWYYLSVSGAAENGWVEIKGKWYYFNASAVMQTGWVKWKNEWYHLNTSGAMDTGWKYINKKWYYFYPKSGKMAYNTTVDGYKLGKDGAWIK
ncbi:MULTISPECIES: S8 family serine peptidase [unclassified Bacillus (in: firmicutes)]|uniref:S8 family serine peptidase n=1 Tax=unclassified Bacillus (in: firmicutes) TaxID=185979 RepID=UPI0008ED8411|nr:MULTISPECIES: S8 family serine peptidase [unclassified Bacillus (in: firmicutes)]SFB20995.1 lactocepin [Bacillus sp. UNCCL13]SFQ90944.1 lactocepin [Bacillus sp. cl95]